MLQNFMPQIWYLIHFSRLYFIRVLVILLHPRLLMVYFVVYSKHCVETYDVFDFMREVVSKVPDYGQAQGQGQGNATMYDRSISKKRCEMVD